MISVYRCKIDEILELVRKLIDAICVLRDSERCRENKIGEMKSLNTSLSCCIKLFQCCQQPTIRSETKNHRRYLSGIEWE